MDDKASIEKNPAPSEENLQTRFSRVASRWRAQIAGKPVTLDMLNQIRMKKRYHDDADVFKDAFIARRTRSDTWNLYSSTFTENANIIFSTETLLEKGLSLKDVLKQFADKPGGGMEYQANQYNHPAMVLKMAQSPK